MRGFVTIDAAGLSIGLLHNEQLLQTDVVKAPINVLVFVVISAGAMTTKGLSRGVARRR
jgi:hypothetical protein